MKHIEDDCKKSILLRFQFGSFSLYCRAAYSNQRFGHDYVIWSFEKLFYEHLILRNTMQNRGENSFPQITLTLNTMFKGLYKTDLSLRFVEKVS